MKGVIGIVEEEKGIWERRVALTPAAVKKLIEDGIKVIVEPSARRCFADSEYAKVGAVISKDLSDCNFILGIKERPIRTLIKDKPFVFFSHIIKAQKYNMGLMDAMLEKNVTLFDYEAIKDESGRRLVKFGWFAGAVGAIDGLSHLGRRLIAKGYSTPYLTVSPTHFYRDLPMCKRALKEMGEEIARVGVHENLGPQVLCVVGDGAVGKGALEMIELMPHKRIVPADLPALFEKGGYDKHMVYTMMLGPQDTVVAKDGHAFDLKEFFANPELYRSVFKEKIAPYLTYAMNGVYWDKRFPRLLTTKDIHDLFTEKKLKLVELCDISCDIGGSFEFMRRETTISDPVYLYDIEHDKDVDGFKKEGILICSVSNFPCELPIEASTHFSDHLAPFLPQLANTEWTKSYDELIAELPKEIGSALLIHKKELTPPFKYIEQWRAASEKKK